MLFSAHLGLMHRDGYQGEGPEDRLNALFPRLGFVL